MATKSGRPARKLHTIPATAELLECSDAHVYRLISAGVLAVVDIAMPGSRRSKTRVRDDSVNAYIESQTRTGLSVTQAAPAAPPEPPRRTPHPRGGPSREPAPAASREPAPVA